MIEYLYYYKKILIKCDTSHDVTDAPNNVQSPITLSQHQREKFVDVIKAIHGDDVVIKKDVYLSINTIRIVAKIFIFFLFMNFLSL